MNDIDIVILFAISSCFLVKKWPRNPRNMKEYEESMALQFANLSMEICPRRLSIGWIAVCFTSKRARIAVAAELFHFQLSNELLAMPAMEFAIQRLHIPCFL